MQSPAKPSQTGNTHILTDTFTGKPTQRDVYKRERLGNSEKKKKNLPWHISILIQTLTSSHCLHPHAALLPK